MKELFDSNNFDAGKALETVASQIKETARGDRDFFKDISGQITVDENRFAIPAGETEAQNTVIRWKWYTKQRSGDLLAIARVTNISDHPVMIKDMMFTAEYVPYCDAADANMFIYHGWDMGVERLHDGAFSAQNVMHISSAEKQGTFIITFVTLSRMQIWHELTVKDGKTEYCVKMPFGEYELPAGESFNSEVMLVADYADPYFALEDWAQKIHDLYQPQLPLKPTVGWCGGWGHWAGEEFGAMPLEEVNVGNAKAINERLKGFGVEYIWTSQGNLKDYIPGNWLKCNDYEIPSGLEGYFKRLMDLGYKPGLWASPFWFFSEAEGMLEEHKDHLIVDKDGKPISYENAWCWKLEDDDLPWYHMHKYNLDGTHPDAIKYVKDVFAYYRSIGVRYYMLDFLGIINEARLFDRTKTPQQAGYNILKEIRKVTGSDTHLQTAVASSPGFTGTINAARIGRDFGEGRTAEGGSLNDWRNCYHVLHDMNYSNLLYFIKNVAGNWFTHQKTYINDFNLMTIDKPFPVGYVQFVTTVYGMGGSNPIMLGDDIRTISDERLAYIKKVLPRTPYSAVPVDLFDRVQPDDYCRIMKLPIKTDWDEYMLVAVYNADPKPVELTLDFAGLGLEGNQVVYDFWNEEYRGVFHDSFPVQVPAESCKLFRFTKYREHPWLIGTDMHIQQGAVDIEYVKWDEDTMTLTGRATRPAGEKGNVILLTPRNFKLKTPVFSLHTMKELLDYRVLVMVPLEFKDGYADFKLDFEYWNVHNVTPRGHIPYSNMEELKEYMEKNYTRENTRVFE